MRADEQRLRGIEPARNSDHDFIDPRRLQPLHKPLGLNFVDFLAAFFAAGRIAQHIRKTLVGTFQGEPLSRRQIRRKANGAKLRGILEMIVNRLGEGVLAHAILGQAVQVDIAGDEVRTIEKSLAFRHKRAVFVDQRLPIPGEVGGGFALTGRAVDVCRQAAAGLIGDKQAPIARFCHGDIGRGDVDEDSRSGHRGIRGRRNGNPQVFANLHEECEQWLVLGLEKQPIAEGNVALAAQIDRVPEAMVGRRELAQLVEFPIIRQISLGDQAKNASLAHHRGAIEKQAIDNQRHSHDGGDGNFRRCLDDLGQRVTAGIEQRLLMKQILAGVRREPQFRERHQQGLALGGFAHQGDGLLGIERRIRHEHLRDRGSDPDEVVVVQIEKAARVSHFSPATTEHPTKSCGIALISLSPGESGQSIPPRRSRWWAPQWEFKYKSVQKEAAATKSRWRRRQREKVRSLLVICRAVAEGMMIRALASSAPMKRRPTRIVKLKRRRK